jgi:DNA polymerase-3 subunit epsilon
VKIADPCGCFPTGRHYPGIAHLIRVRVFGIAEEISPDADWIEEAVAFIDTETTGRDPENDRIVELGIVVGRRGEIVFSKSWLFNPGIPISAESNAVHGISDDDVRDQPPFRERIAEIAEALRGAIPAAYNAAFDKAFIHAELARSGMMPAELPPAFRRDVEWTDPLILARELHQDAESRALGEMAARLGIEIERAHRATDDARAALKVLYAFAASERVPRKYAALIQEQRRLGREQEEARRFWKKS